MQNKLKSLKATALKQIQDANSQDSLRELEIRFLGQKGELTGLLRSLSTLSPEERKLMGQVANAIKMELMEVIKDKKEQLLRDYYHKLAQVEWQDMTMPAATVAKGSIHPISQFISKVEDVFLRMGFDIADGPEIETEYYNFSALNVPADHPAREMQDTFWMETEAPYVLRTQTSNMQIRYMENHKPPIRVIAPGKTYRKDSDATHSPMFHQFEGLMIDKNITVSHLRAVLLTALRQLLHPHIRLRLRTAYFPFVEPGIEGDVSCINCQGMGKKDDGSNCGLCKGTGWMEMFGAGMVHPTVLKNGGLDPKKYTGFAFGFGIERLTMVKHKIDNIRLLYDNDIRFLEQF